MKQLFANVCVYTAHSPDTNRGLGPLMGLREFSASEFIHGLFISKKVFINKITAPSDRAKDLPTQNEDGSTTSWCQLLAALTWWDVFCRHQVLERCIHMDQTCPLTWAGFGAQKESPEMQQGQNSGKDKVQKSLLTSVWTSCGCGKEKLSSVPEPFLILWKWLLDATASSLSLPHSLQGSGNKTWPEAVQLLPLCSLQMAKSTSLTIFCEVCDQPGSLLQGMIRFQATVWICQRSLENM